MKRILFTLRWWRWCLLDHWVMFQTLEAFPEEEKKQAIYNRWLQSEPKRPQS